jgi:hypothetical protein
MPDMQMISRGIEGNGAHGYDHGLVLKDGTLIDLNPGF